MPGILIAEDVVRRIAAECAYVGVASAFGWNRRLRSCASTASNSAHRAVRGGLDR
jgi:hypothetical protein